MERYTKKDKDGRYYIESVNGKLESDVRGHTYGKAIDRFAELEDADELRKSQYHHSSVPEVSKAVERQTNKDVH